jgi:tetrahydromethanopterin S-methyltransferase subunit B
MPIGFTPVIIGVGVGAFVYSKLNRYPGREKMAIISGAGVGLFVGLIFWSIIDLLNLT